MKSLADLMGERVVQKPKKGIHSERHELIDQLRRDYGETAKKGVGSFSYYLGMLKPYTTSAIYGWRSQAKEAKSPQKLFWWLVGQEGKKKLTKQL